MFRKFGDEVVVIYNPRVDKLEVGQTLRVFDKAEKRGLLVQVIEQNLVDLSGILEDIVRRESLGEVTMIKHEPPEYAKYHIDVKNMKFARAKIRKEIRVSDGSEAILDWTGWIPDRSAELSIAEDRWILEKLGIQESCYKHAANIGKTTVGREPFTLSTFHLQGISLIVGKKGTGKSHLAKALLLGLVDRGAYAIVFDINDEYSSMRLLKDENRKSPYSDRLVCLNPGQDLRFTLPYVGRDVFLSVLATLGIREDTPSGIEARARFERLEQDGTLSFSSYKSNIEGDPALRSDIKDALSRRLGVLESCQIFTDKKKEAVTLEGVFSDLKKGGGLVVNLKAKSRLVRDIVVQTLLSKVQSLRESAVKGEDGIPPIFLLAEEAHMYLGDAGGTRWDDVVTRMRHLGTYQFYMTNTPTDLPLLVIRQVDNLFLFHLANETDLRHVAPAGKIDEDTVLSIARSLPARKCLAIGSATGEYPFVLDVKDLPVSTAGKTVLYFEEP